MKDGVQVTVRNQNCPWSLAKLLPTIHGQADQSERTKGIIDKGKRGDGGGRRRNELFVILHPYILHLHFISDWVDGCITLKFKIWLNNPNMEVKSTLFFWLFVFLSCWLFVVCALFLFPCVSLYLGGREKVGDGHNKCGQKHTDWKHGRRRVNDEGMRKEKEKSRKGGKSSLSRKWIFLAAAHQHFATLCD